MDGRFSRALGRLNSVGASRLADSLGAYQPAVGPLVQDLQLQIDRNIQLAGADERFQVGMVAITCAKAELGAVARGGVFSVGAESWTVSDLLSDDGHFITAACMVNR